MSFENERLLHAIELAQQREDALGQPAVGAPTVMQLRSVYDLCAQWFEITNSDATDNGVSQWKANLRVLIGMAFTVNQWESPESDAIGKIMYPDLTATIRQLVVELLDGDDAFIGAYNPGKVILDETGMSLSIGSVVAKLHQRFMETQAALLAFPFSRDCDLEPLRHLLKRWLTLLMAYSDARQGSTYQNALMKAKQPKKQWWKS